ncbi:MAG: hypothetical protein ACTHN7_04040 [Solirubrobacterales bacterium]
MERDRDDVALGPDLLRKQCRQRLFRIEEGSEASARDQAAEGGEEEVVEVPGLMDQRGQERDRLEGLLPRFRFDPPSRHLPGFAEEIVRPTTADPERDPEELRVEPSEIGLYAGG